MRPALPRHAEAFNPSLPALGPVRGMAPHVQSPPRTCAGGIPVRGLPVGPPCPGVPVTSPRVGSPVRPRSLASPRWRARPRLCGPRMLAHSGHHTTGSPGVSKSSPRACPERAAAPTLGPHSRQLRHDHGGHALHADPRGRAARTAQPARWSGDKPSLWP